MTNRFDCQSPHAAAYLARPPERLVLEGYRQWIYGVASGHEPPWRQASTLYHEVLAPREASAAIEALSDFVSTLGRCATCPLKTFETGSRHICRDEVLVMGLVSGIQNRDDTAAELCLTELSCATRCNEAAMAAGSFALILRGFGKTLLPIPEHVVRDILTRSRAYWHATQSNPTLH